MVANTTSAAARMLRSAQTVRRLDVRIARRDVSSTRSVRSSDEKETASKSKPSIANIAELRKLLPGTSMIKAREALNATANSVQGALSWLENDLQIAGAKKASKLVGREAKEGGIACCIVTDGAPTGSTSGKTSSVTLAARASIVELNCETDFVGRNEIFQQLLADIAHTVALFPTLALDDGTPNTSQTDNSNSQSVIDLPVEQLLGFPLIPRPISQGVGQDAANVASAPPKTIGNAILDVITRLGEKVHLARASALSNVTVPSPSAPRRSQTVNEVGDQSPWIVSSAFTHGGVNAPASQLAEPQISIGRVGALLLTQIRASQHRNNEADLKSMRGLTRSLARQAAGMPTTSIEAQIDQEPESALYEQPFIMRLPTSKLADAAEQAANDSEHKVGQALQAWGKAWSKLDSNSSPVKVIALRRWRLGQ